MYVSEIPSDFKYSVRTMFDAPNAMSRKEADSHSSRVSLGALAIVRSSISVIVSVSPGELERLRDEMSLYVLGQ